MRKQFLFGMVLASLLGTASAATVFSENFQGATVSLGTPQNGPGVITGTSFSLMTGASIDINGAPNSPGNASDAYGRLCSGFFTDSTQKCLDTTGGGGLRGDFQSTNTINFVQGVQYTLTFVLYQWNDNRNGTQPALTSGFGAVNTMLRVRVGTTLFDTIYDSSLCAAACAISTNFTPTADNAGLQNLRFTDNGPGTGFAGAILDDVKITDNTVPEPATFAFVGLGVAALAVVRRKRT